MREQTKSFDCLASGFEPNTFAAAFAGFGSARVSAWSWAAKPRKAFGTWLTLGGRFVGSQARGRGLFSGFGSLWVAHSLKSAHLLFARWLRHSQAFKIQGQGVSLCGLRLASAPHLTSRSTGLPSAAR